MGVIQAQGVNQGTWWAGKSGIGGAHRPSLYCPSHLRGAKTRAQGFSPCVFDFSPCGFDLGCGAEVWLLK